MNVEKGMMTMMMAMIMAVMMAAIIQQILPVQAAPLTAYTCSYCGEEFATYEALFAHLKDTHRREPPCANYGDIDNDGWVTGADAELVGRYIVDLITLTTEELARADVNDDGIVDAVDAMFISQYVKGLRDTFPVCGI